MSGRVPPSSRSRVARAADLFERFTGHGATRGERVRIVVPDVALVVGTLDGLLYTAVRDGIEERYIHEFAKRDRPILAASADGRQLMIVGGGYRMTELGIVDDSDKKHRHAR